MHIQNGSTLPIRGAQPLFATLSLARVAPKTSADEFTIAKNTLTRMTIATDVAAAPKGAWVVSVRVSDLYLATGGVRVYRRLARATRTAVAQQARVPLSPDAWELVLNTRGTGT